MKANRYRAHVNISMTDKMKSQLEEISVEQNESISGIARTEFEKMIARWQGKKETCKQ